MFFADVGEPQFSIIHALKGDVHLTDMKYLIKLWSVLLLCTYVHKYVPIQYFYDDPQYSRSTLVGLRDFIKAENKVFLYTYFHTLKTQVTKFK